MSQQIVLLFLLLQGSDLFKSPLIPMLAIMFIGYMFFIRPKVKQERAQQQAIEDMRNNLKPGDKVVTTGGLYGQIVSVREDKRTVQLKIAENVRVEVARTAISGIQEVPEQKS